MRKLLHFLCFAVMLAMSACSGDDGAIGPKGDPGESGLDGEQGDQGNQGEQGIPGDYSSKSGFFEGTVTGARKDGTAFSEDFKFEFAYGADIYSGNILDLNRFETIGGAVAYKTTGFASSIDKGYALLSAFVDVEEWEPNDFQFGLVKELTPATLFVLNGRPYLREENYDRLLELTPENNGKYNLAITETGTIWYSQADTDHDDITDAWMFQIAGTDKFLYYSMDNGALLYIETATGPLTSGDLFDKYNALKFVDDAEVRSMVFVNAADDSPAWEYVETVPSDVITISNFVDQDGVVSFDFNVTISKYRGYLTSWGGMGGYIQNGTNSTRHDITITGKFNSGGKVYESTVGRRG